MSDNFPLEVANLLSPFAANYLPDGTQGVYYQMAYTLDVDIEINQPHFTIR